MKNNAQILEPEAQKIPVSYEIWRALLYGLSIYGFILLIDGLVNGRLLPHGIFGTLGLNVLACYLTNWLVLSRLLRKYKRLPTKTEARKFKFFLSIAFLLLIAFLWLVGLSFSETTVPTSFDLLAVNFLLPIVMVGLITQSSALMFIFGIIFYSCIFYAVQRPLIALGFLLATSSLKRKILAVSKVQLRNNEVNKK